MTTEEIIQRLLDEKKISVKEAMIILKDLARIRVQQIFTPNTIKDIPHTMDVVMYGIQYPSYPYNSVNPDGSSITSESASTSSD